jgi:hypothetical protein
MYWSNQVARILFVLGSILLLFDVLDYPFTCIEIYRIASIITFIVFILDITIPSIRITTCDSKTI